MEESTTRKKRPRASEAMDGDDKKRGRPRVEKEGESAADRRRTQIRMAQRAYRQRKESTLDDLRKRVSDLTNTIEVMNKLFEDCRDRLYASSLPDAQMSDLGNTAAEFEMLVKDARNPNEEQIEEVPKVIARASTSSKISEAPSLAATQPKNVPSWMDQTVIAPSFDPNAKGSTEIGLGYTMLLPDSESQAPLMTYGGLDLDPLDIDESPNFPQLNNGDTFDVFRAATTETLSVPDSLSPPITYSFQETSIARRIHRACAECAYQLVLDPRRRPAEYERIFRLTMLGRDREKIGQALKSVLDKGPHEELEFTAAPLVRVGGAGTHYPRRDAFGKVIPRRPAVNIGVIGPQTLSMLESATKGQVPTDVMIELAGFEGEWFDPYDVQGYLEEKGIFIDPTSSFAEAEIVEWPQSSSKGSTTSSNNGHTPPPTYSSPGRSTPLTGTQIEKMITEADADLGQWNEFSNMQLTAVGYSDAASGSWMNFVQPGKGVNPITQQTQPSLWENLPTDFTNKDITGGVHNQQQSSPQPRRKNVIIDVSKFVKVMTISGVCLGRTPGFRRRDVDRALAISSFDAF